MVPSARTAFVRFARACTVSAAFCCRRSCTSPCSRSHRRRWRQPLVFSIFIRFRDAPFCVRCARLSRSAAAIFAARFGVQCSLFPVLFDVTHVVMFEVADTTSTSRWFSTSSSRTSSVPRVSHGTSKPARLCLLLACTSGLCSSTAVPSSPRMTKSPGNSPKQNPLSRSPAAAAAAGRDAFRRPRQPLAYVHGLAALLCVVARACSACRSARFSSRGSVPAPPHRHIRT